jgi:hypothetical protein
MNMDLKQIKSILKNPEKYNQLSNKKKKIFRRSISHGSTIKKSTR